VPGNRYKIRPNGEGHHPWWTEQRRSIDRLQDSKGRQRLFSIEKVSMCIKKFDVGQMTAWLYAGLSSSAAMSAVINS
jgi:hypothetical protein